MASFTLDTNCILAVEEDRNEASAIRALAEAHARGGASVAAVAISASERQKDGTRLKSFTAFRHRLEALGLGHLELLKPIAYFGITFFDWCVFSGPELRVLERRIHEILFPNIPFLWSDYCKQNGLDPQADVGEHRWRNAKCDVLAFWCHVHCGRDVFVTSDKNFHTQLKRSALLALGGTSIAFPAEAIVMLGGGHAN